MRVFLWRWILWVSLPVVCSVALAEEEEPDPSSMLKVPPAGARPVEDGAEVKAAGTPEPEPATESTEDPSEEATPPAGDDVVLPAFPLSRYEALWQRSPFQVESVAPPVESAGLAQRFALTGLAAINGEAIAFLMDRATQNRVMVKKDSTEGGLSLVQVDVQQKYSDSTATVRQGSEVGVVRFDASAAAPGMMPPAGMAQQPMRAVPPGIPQPGMPQQPMAQIPGVPQGVPMPGQPVPGQPVPQPPGVVPGMPGPGVPQDGQVQGDPGQMPPPRVIRRRALIPAAP
jgi:hypothetical protein